jgi:surfeit locus 1 family protein
VTLAALVILVSLGGWQVRRLHWKEALIERASKRPTERPIDLISEDLDNISDPAFFLELYEYRLADVAGEYLPSGEALVFTSLEPPKGRFGGPGYWVLTPLRTRSSERLIYVNRGFVPQDRKDAYDPPPSGRVALKGLIRSPEPGSFFTPDADPQNRIFYARDVERIAAATGAGEAVGFFIDLEASETPASGLPQGGETRLRFVNNHLQYAITWYGLAAVLLAVFGAYCWRSLNERVDDGA